MTSNSLFYRYTIVALILFGGTTWAQEKKKMYDKEIKKLTPLQFDVTQKDGTEPPFKNEYWDSKEPGIYVDIVSGEALFSSTHKFKSGTGWPSFYQVLEPGHVKLKKDRKLFVARTELRSSKADSHLGHVFDDGPAPTGKRYCINSASLRFIPKDQLTSSGYGKYLSLFTQAEDEKKKEKIAIFAGGCFWCMEPPFDKTPGVLDTESGYIGGKIENPSYKQVSAGGTGHTEAIRIRYNSDLVSYEKLLEIFWRNIDPTVKNRQFCDVGSQYRTGIFYLDDDQRQFAEKSQKKISAQFGTIHTELTKATTFWPAEDYHQDYYKKNPVRYKYYRYTCGRDKRLNELWQTK